MTFKRFAIGAAIVVVFLGLLLLYRRWTANDVEVLIGREDPFAVRLALIDDTNDDATEVLAQMIVFPAEERIALFFVNTDAHPDDDDEPISAMSPGSADNFEEYTDIATEYYIHIRRSNAVRLLNLCEGITIFIDEPLVLEGSEFYYPKGTRFLPGEQMVEYMIARSTGESEPILNSVVRMNRAESMLLNIFWRRQACGESISESDLGGIATSLIETDLFPAELDSLVSYIMDTETLEMGVFEVPLMVQQIGRDERLLVNPERANVVYNRYLEDLNSGKLKATDYPVDVLNGTHVAGQARRLKQYLQDRGLRVLDADNYEYKPVLRSVIIERSGNTSRAAHLRETTGLEEERVVFRRGRSDVDITFLIGADFDMKDLPR